MGVREIGIPTHSKKRAHGVSVMPKAFSRFTVFNAKFSINSSLTPSPDAELFTNLESTA